MAYTYNIGSDKGKSVANNMKSGDSYKASDGSTWKKNSDGSISVTTKSGNTYASNYGATSSSSSSSSKSSGSSGSSGGSSSSSSSSNGNKTVTVGSSGNAPAGLSMGTIVNTAGGDYKIVDKNTPGASYNAASNYYSVKMPTSNSGNVTQDNKAGQTEQKTNISVPAGVTKTTYTHNGKQVEGYIQNGVTYDMQGNKAANGSIVSAGDKTWMKLADGSSIDITGYTKANAYGKDSEDNTKYNTQLPLKEGLINYKGVTYDPSTGEVYRNTAAAAGTVVRAQNGKYYDAQTGEDVTLRVQMQQGQAAPLEDPNAGMQAYLNEIMQQYNQVIAADPTLTREQALALAVQQLNPQYNQGFEQAMAQLDKNALQSGFFGQLPTEALKRETAGKLEVDKLNAINALAAQLFGQSEESAQNKLSAAEQSQQNKINTMLQLLGIYQNERSYNDSRVADEWEKAMQEASLTGNYNGQPTLDFLNYQRLNNRYVK